MTIFILVALVGEVSGMKETFTYIGMALGIPLLAAAAIAAAGNGSICMSDV